MAALHIILRKVLGVFVLGLSLTACNQSPESDQTSETANLSLLPKVASCNLAVDSASNSVVCDLETEDNSNPSSCQFFETGSGSITCQHSPEACNTIASTDPEYRRCISERPAYCIQVCSAIATVDGSPAGRCTIIGCDFPDDRGPIRPISPDNF